MKKTSRIKKTLRRKSTSSKRVAPRTVVAEAGLKLNRLDRDPPGGWFYDCWDGWRVQAGHWGALVNFVKEHYRVNQREAPPDLEALIQQQICQRIPQSLCHGQGPKRFVPTLSQIENGTRLLIDFFLRHGPTIPAEAEARAAECLQCEYNVFISGCRGCEWVYRLLDRLFRSHTTVYDKDLKVCAVCGCMAKAQIHCQAQTLWEVTPKYLIDDYPQATCWKGRLLRQMREKLKP